MDQVIHKGTTAEGRCQWNEVIMGLREIRRTTGKCHWAPVFINDMPNEIKCNIQLFPDDENIFKTVKNEEDHQDLAKDLV